MAQIHKQWAVPLENLAVRYDPSKFSFKTTEEIHESNKGIIGQDRAVKAMQFGLNIKQQGYNIFMVGPSSTGKTTYALNKVSEIAKQRQTPNDRLYVYNFKRPDKPIAISLAAGKGLLFSQECEELIQDISTNINHVINSEDYDKQKAELLAQYERKINEPWEKLEQEAVSARTTIKKTNHGFTTVPMNQEGKKMSEDDFNSLEQIEKDKILEQMRYFQQKISDLIRKTQIEEREVRHALKDMDKDIVHFANHDLIEQLQEKYKDDQCIVDYLDHLEQDILQNWRDFLTSTEEEEKNARPLLQQTMPKDKNRYKVHLFVDHSDTEGAPFYYESNPTYSNLFGQIKYVGADNRWITDFTKIKPGAFHLANGGFIILQASDLLKNPEAYHAIKRMLKTREIRLENIMEERGLISNNALRPEAIPLDIKVVLIGTPDIYQMLYQSDDDFRKFFKVKADFDVEMDRHDIYCSLYASFVSDYCRQEGLRHLTAEAVANVIDYSTRISGDQRKLSTSFHEVTEILVESHYMAEESKHPYVQSEHIKQALQERRYRSNRVEQKMCSLIEEGTIMVTTKDRVIGQINGLAYLNMGDFTFGQPHKITARTFMGRSEIMNIERESLLSGRIHSKGLLILSGYLQGEFAKNKPLPLSVSITFEQNYSMVDGDSASSTELYALLSSLANIPIKQGIAVTGSVNQWGEIQPIGGVNEKIEGFYYICKAQGFTGEQGVIIPVQNTKNLMLHDDLLQSVEKEEFHIWAIDNIKAGIEILTDVPAGERNAQGQFQPGSLYEQVEKRLDYMFNQMVSLRDIQIGESKECLY